MVDGSRCISPAQYRTVFFRLDQARKSFWHLFRLRVLCLIGAPQVFFRLDRRQDALHDRQRRRRTARHRDIHRNHVGDATAAGVTLAENAAGAAAIAEIQAKFNRLLERLDLGELDDFLILADFSAHERVRLVNNERGLKSLRHGTSG